MSSGILRACCCETTPPCCQCSVTIGTVIDGVSGSGDNVTISVSPADCDGLPSGGSITVAANTTASPSLCFSRDAHVVIAVPNVVVKSGTNYYFSRWTVDGCVGNTGDFLTTDGDGNRLYYGLALPIDTCVEGDCGITAIAHYATVASFPGNCACPSTVPPLIVQFVSLQVPSEYLSYPNEVAYVDEFMERCLGSSLTEIDSGDPCYKADALWATCGPWDFCGVDPPSCSPDYGILSGVCYLGGGNWGGSIPFALSGWRLSITPISQYPAWPATPNCTTGWNSSTGVQRLAGVRLSLQHYGGACNALKEEPCTYPPDTIGRGTVDHDFELCAEFGPFATAEAYCMAWRDAIRGTYEFPYGQYDWGEVVTIA